MAKSPRSPPRACQQFETGWRRRLTTCGPAWGPGRALTAHGTINPVAISVAAVRVRSARRRLADLRERMARLRAGEIPTRDDVERARAFTRAQQAATTQAYMRLMRTHASAAAHTRRMAELADPPARSREHPTGRQLVRENERLRDAIVAIQTYSAQSARIWSEEQRRSVWQALVDECRSGNWRSWAQAVCTVATQLVPGARGAALTLYDQDDVPWPMAATDRWTRNIEEVHRIVGEGPALEVSTTHRRVLVDDLTNVYARWPGFVEAASAAALRGLWSFPVPVTDTNAGSLTLYWTGTAAPDRAHQPDAALLAEVASLALLADVDALKDLETVDPSGYDGVQIAAGMLSVRLGVSVDQAMVEMRAHAYGSGRSLEDMAQDVMGGTFPEAHEP